MAKKRIPIEEVQPGMTLAEPISDRTGRVIVAAGMKLSPVVISRLGKWNVASVTVEVEETSVHAPVGGGEAAGAADGAAPSTSESAEISERMIRLEHVFARAGENPVMVALHELARKHLAAWTGRLGRK